MISCSGDVAVRLDDGGYGRAGSVADTAVLDADGIRDSPRPRARQYAEGMVQVLVNGRFAVWDGDATGVLAGEPIRRPWIDPARSLPAASPSWRRAHRVRYEHGRSTAAGSS